MSRTVILETLKEQQEIAQRNKAKAYKGSVATHRDFQKWTTYTGAELRAAHRKTPLDDAPSRMGDYLRYRDGRIEKVNQ